MSDLLALDNIDKLTLSELEMLRTKLLISERKVSEKIKELSEKSEFNEMTKDINANCYFIVNPHPKYDEFKKKYNSERLTFSVDRKWNYSKYQDNPVFKYLEDKLPEFTEITKGVVGDRYAHFDVIYKDLLYGKGLTYSFDKEEIQYIIYTPRYMSFYNEYEGENPDMDKKINGYPIYIKFGDKVYSHRQTLTIDHSSSILYHSKYMIPLEGYEFSIDS